MRWVVDGMNVIGARPDGWWRDRAAARRGLVRALQIHAADTGASVTVVFDGRPGDGEAGRHSGVDVRFAPGGPNAADRVIEQIVAGLEDPATVTVVTSDRALESAVIAMGASVLSSLTFRRRLSPSADHD